MVAARAGDIIPQATQYEAGMAKLCEKLRDCEGWLYSEDKGPGRGRRQFAQADFVSGWWSPATVFKKCAKFYGRTTYKKTGRGGEKGERLV